MDISISCTGAEVDMELSRRPVPSLVAHLSNELALLTSTDSATVDCCWTRQVTDASLLHRPVAAGKLLVIWIPGSRAALTDHSSWSQRYRVIVSPT